MGQQLVPSEKKPMPINYIRPVKKTKSYLCPEGVEEPSSDKYDVRIEVAKESNGQRPTLVVYGDRRTKTVDSVTEPICSTIEKSQQNATDGGLANGKPDLNGPAEERCEQSHPGHCTCCVLLRKICRVRQRLITEYFRPRLFAASDPCPCRRVDRPRVTNKLRLLLKYYNSRSMYVHKDMKMRYYQCDENKADFDYANIPTESITEVEDLSDPHDSGGCFDLILNFPVRLG